MTRISKDGGIEDMVKTSHKPINRVDKVTIRSLQTDPMMPSDQAAGFVNPPPKITYGSGVGGTSPRMSPRSGLLVPPSPNRQGFGFQGGQNDYESNPSLAQVIPHES